MADTLGQSGYAPVNGLAMYYEVHGTGRPLVLLHGGFGTVDMFAPLLPTLAETRQVIVVELQGHGHTADIDRPLSFEQMADDVAALIRHLGHDHADLLGYSLGGGVALQTVIRHPDVVRNLIVASAAYASDGWYPEVRAGMAAVNADAARTWVGSPMHESYARVAPQPDEWPNLAAKTGNLLRQPYDWTAGMATITAPVLILIGDADSIAPAHAVEMFGLLGGGKTDGAMGGRPTSQLAILPATTHFTILDHTDLLLPIISSFLDTPMSEAE
jgi:pimeloyl-ACP methyl ester carboxylesterase